MVQTQPGQIAGKTLSQKYPTQGSGAKCLTGKHQAEFKPGKRVNLRKSWQGEEHRNSYYLQSTKESRVDSSKRIRTKIPHINSETSTVKLMLIKANFYLHAI
jgi:hypothetical protein